MGTADDARQALDQIADVVREARNPSLSWSTTARLLDAAAESVEHVRGLVDDLAGRER